MSKKQLQRRVEYLAYINSWAWQVKRRHVLARDGHRCKRCRSTRDLHVHHLTYARFKREELRDLVTLCKLCHEKEHPRRRRRRERSPEEWMARRVNAELDAEFAARLEREP